MIIIGSYALHHNGSITRDVKDIDYAISESWKEEAFTSNQYGYNHDFIPFPCEALDLMWTNLLNGEKVALTSDVMTIKLSHMGWDHLKNPSIWHKHRRDVLLLKSKGFKVNEGLYNVLRDHWRLKWGNKDFLSLEQSKESFFDDNVEYKIDHDEMHRICKKVPTYTKCLADGEDVKISKKKFDMMSFDDRISMFKEEMHVIAYERYIYGKKKPMNILQAWNPTLHKTVTQLTKNWATDFILMNIEHFAKPDVGMVTNLQRGLKL